MISICMSPWPNLSVTVASPWPTPRSGPGIRSADRLLATGMPKIPAATITKTAAAMTRRGAAMASHAIRCSTSRPPYARGRKISGNLFRSSIMKRTAASWGSYRRHYADVEDLEYAARSVASDTVRGRRMSRPCLRHKGFGHLLTFFIR